MDWKSLLGSIVFVWSFMILTLSIEASDSVNLPVSSNTSTIVGIVGGNYISIEEAPYQVSLIIRPSNRPTFFCGGQIINVFFTLSASHCFENVKPNSVTLRAGSTLLDRGGVTVRLRNIIRHPKFDAALLRHMDRLKFSRVLQPIALPNANKVIREGELCITSGWGKTSENEFMHDFNRRLKAVVLPFIGHDHCNKLLNPRLKIRNEEVCAGYERGGVDSCGGDSGGPLIHPALGPISKRTIVGIVSNGIGCALPKLPGIYVDVRKISEWIRQVTRV